MPEIPWFILFDDEDTEPYIPEIPDGFDSADIFRKMGMPPTPAKDDYSWMKPFGEDSAADSK